MNCPQNLWVQLHPLHPRYLGPCKYLIRNPGFELDLVQRFVDVDPLRGNEPTLVMLRFFKEETLELLKYHTT